MNEAAQAKLLEHATEELKRAGARIGGDVERQHSEDLKQAFENGARRERVQLGHFVRALKKRFPSEDTTKALDAILMYLK